MNEDAVLLREASHRAGNDCAVALAALRLLDGAGSGDPARRASLIGRATLRLEASAELHRVLARPVPREADLSEWLSAVCAATAATGPDPVEVELRLERLCLDGSVARRLVLIAAELVANAVKYAARGPGGVIVSAVMAGGWVTLSVVDSGPGIVPGLPATGGGLGSGIVADLVALGGGRITMETGVGGTAFTIDMPVIKGGVVTGGCGSSGAIAVGAAVRGRASGRSPAIAPNTP